MRIKTHPGEVLREEFMEPLRLSCATLSAALHVDVGGLGEVIAERQTVTADLALRLSRYFGTSPEFWLNLQQAHDLSVAQAETGDLISREVSPRAA